MRCKRCGELLDPADTRCRVCGKTQTPPRRRPPAQKPGENQIKLPQLDRFSNAYHRDSARSRKLQLATLAAVAAAAVLLVLIYISVGHLQTAVEQLQQDSQTLLQTQREPAPAPTDPTEPTEPATQPADGGKQLPLNQQDVAVELTLQRIAGGTFAAAEMDLGGFQDRAVTWVNTAGKSADRENSAAWILEKSGDRLDVKLCDSYSGAEGRFFASLVWSLTGDTFGSYSNAMCIWEYRLSGGEWESMPMESMTAVPGGCEVRLTPEELAVLLESGGQLEMRCHVSMTHSAGGTMKITAGGIVLDAAGLTVSDGLMD